MTVSQTRTLLFQYVAEEDPYSPKYISRLNQVVERFHNNGQWKGMIAEEELTVASGVVSLPIGFQSLLGIRIDGWPQEIVSQHYDFNTQGPGKFLDCAGSGGLIVDLGDDATTGRKKYRLNYEAPDEVIGLMQRRFVLLANEDDDVVPSNIGALKNGLMALNYEDQNDLERAAAYWTQAMNLLNNETEAARGAARRLTPIQPFGLGIPPVANVT